MAIDLKKLEVMFDTLFSDEAIEEKFWDWYVARNKAASTAKPNVSGDAFELLKEIRQRLLLDINENGEPNSSMEELFGMWDKVNMILTANNQK